jgi:hypothetical protein
VWRGDGGGVTDGLGGVRVCGAANSGRTVLCAINLGV